MVAIPAAIAWCLLLAARSNLRDVLLRIDSRLAYRDRRPPPQPLETAARRQRRLHRLIPRPSPDGYLSGMINHGKRPNWHRCCEANDSGQARRQCEERVTG